MTPVKTIITIGGIRHTKESVDGTSFPLSPQELMDILGIGSKTTLFRHEIQAGLRPNRTLRGQRRYSDSELFKLAQMSAGVSAINTDETVITGQTGNQAFLPLKR